MKRTLLFALAILLTGTTYAQYDAEFDPTVLNGENGFRMTPTATSHSRLGHSVSFIGDINNDGLDDIAIADDYDTGLDLSITRPGKVFVVFGVSTTMPADFELSSLDGSNGFVLQGKEEEDRMGEVVTGIGDVNGDGISDLLTFDNDGAIVIYGKTGDFPALLERTDIDGTNGFLIDEGGISSVADAGDHNGDGINDFIIGVPHWDKDAWIVFGRSDNFPATISTSYFDGTNGYIANDFNVGSRPAYVVSGAGDVNNDGYDDVIIGAWTNSHVEEDIQMSYLVYGHGGDFDSRLALDASTEDVAVQVSNEGNSFISRSSSAGDINNDGIDDFVSDGNVFFGSTTAYPRVLSQTTLDGTNGFHLPKFSFPAPIGDFNNDGIDDLILDGSLVLFGKDTSFTESLTLDYFDGVNGFTFDLNWSDDPGSAGRGDFNGDGIADIVTRTMVIFGGKNISKIQPSEITFNTLDNAIYGDADIELSATASSGLEITYVSSNPLIAEISNGKIVIKKTGTCNITASQSGNSNYEAADDVVQNFIVLKKEINIITNANQSKVYGDIDPTLTYTADALVGSDTFSGVLIREVGDNVGSYSISQNTLTAGANYDITFTGSSFKINQKAIYIAVNAGQSKVYGDIDPTLTYTADALVGSDTFSGVLIREVGDNVGSYSISQNTLSAGANYDITFTESSFKINQKAIYIAVNAGQSKIYGATEPALNYTSDALVGSDTFSGVLIREVGDNIGSYSISQNTLSAGANYDITFTGSSFKINQKNINVTAKANQSKVYGDIEPALTYTADELVGSDTYSGNLSREGGEDVGYYEILIGSLSAGINYNLSFYSEDFEVTEALSESNIPMNEFSIYPNPTKGTLNVKTLSGKFSTMSIISNDGKVVLKKPFTNSTKTTIDVSSLKSGLYIIRAVTANGDIQSTKFHKL